MFTRRVRHNQNTGQEVSTIVRPRGAWFAQPVGAGAYFAPPLARGVMDTNGDFIYLLAPTPTQHSNPRYGGTARVTGGNEHLTTTIFG